MTDLLLDTFNYSKVYNLVTKDLTNYLLMLYTKIKALLKED